MPKIKNRLVSESEEPWLFLEHCKAALDLDYIEGKQMKGCVDGKLIKEGKWTEAYQKVRKSK